MKRKAWQGGLSLVELIVALTLLSGVLLMTVTVRFNFQGLVNMGMNQAILFLNTHLALDRIVSAIQHANYLEIDEENNALTLSRKVGEEYISSRYYRDPGGNLCYQPDLSKETSPEIVLPSVTGFQLTGFPEGGTRFQMARVRLEAEDPQGIARRDAMFQTAAFCRIFHGINKPVRVVTRDSSGNVTTVKGSYDTIQAAIDAATTLHGDVVQVSSNDKTPYVESVTIKKALTLEGGYDSVDWERHYADPTNPGQIDEAYETIIEGVDSKVLTFGGKMPGKMPGGETKIIIDGFTVRRKGEDMLGIYYYVWDEAIGVKVTIKITNNKIINSAYSDFHGIGIYVTSPRQHQIVVANNILRDEWSNPTPDIGYNWRGIVISAPGSLEIRGNQLERNTQESQVKPGSSDEGVKVLVQTQSEMISIVNNSYKVNAIGFKVDKTKFRFRVDDMQAIYVGDERQATYGSKHPNLLVANNLVENHVEHDTNCLIKFRSGNGFANVVISNNFFRYSEDSPSIVFTKRADGFTFQNNVKSDDGSGHLSINITGATFASAIFTNNLLNKTSLDLASTQFDTRGFSIFNNSFHNSSGDPIFAMRFYQVDVWRKVYVYRNYIFKGSGIHIRNNYGPGLIANNIFDHTAKGVYIDGLTRIENNTFYKNSYGFYANDGLNGGSSDIFNNIFEKNTQNDLYFANVFHPKHRFYVKHNVMEKGLQKFLKSSVLFQEENVFSTDDKLVDPENLKFYLASGSPAIDAGDPVAGYNDIYDKVAYPTPVATTPALPPAKGTIRNDIGAYGGPHAGVIGFVQPTVDDPTTPYIREDVIGTY